MTYQQARALYQARQKLFDALRFMVDCGPNVSERRPSIEGVIQVIDFEFDGYVSGFNYKNSGQLPADVLGVLVSLITSGEFGSIGPVLTLMGLSRQRPRHPKEAEALVDRSIERAVNGRHSKGEVNDWVIGDLRVKTGLTNTDQVPRTRHGLISWLTKNRSDAFLSGVAVRVGSILAESEGFYADIFRDQVRHYESENEAGRMAPLAKRYVGRADVSPGDFALYSIGHLPDSHIQQLAKKDTTITLMESLWNNFSGLSPVSPCLQEVEGRVETIRQ